MRISTLLLAGCAAVNGAITSETLVSTLAYWGKYSSTATKMTERLPADVDRDGWKYKFVLNIFRKIQNDTIDISKDQDGSFELSEGAALEVLGFFEQFTSQHQTFLGTLNAKEPVWKGNQDVVEEVWSGLYGDEHSLNWFTGIVGNLFPSSQKGDFETQAKELIQSVEKAVDTWQAGDPRGLEL